MRVCVVWKRDLTLTPSTSLFMLTANRLLGSVLMLSVGGLAMAIPCEASPRNRRASCLNDARIVVGGCVGIGRICLWFVLFSCCKASFYTHTTSQP